MSLVSKNSISTQRVGKGQRSTPFRLRVGLVNDKMTNITYPWNFITTQPWILFYKTLDFIWEKNLARLNPQITLSIVLKILGQYAGPSEPEQIKGGFYVPTTWKPRYNVEVDVWAHFYKILLVFEYLIDPMSKGCLENAKSTKSW